jgi:hypothetical protein
VYWHLRLDEPILPAQFNGQNFCYLCKFVIGMQRMPELFNNEASQSNYGACSSAAGDKAEFLFSAFADVKNATIQQLLTGTKHIRMALSYNC